MVLGGFVILHLQRGTQHWTRRSSSCCLNWLRLGGQSCFTGCAAVCPKLCCRAPDRCFIPAPETLHPDGPRHTKQHLAALLPQPSQQQGA